jgi:hypothetical protein
MAINLSKNQNKNFVYNTKEKKRMKFLIYMTAFMFICTTSVILLALCALTPSWSHLFIIMCMSALGYLTTIGYYSEYRKERNQFK